MGIWRFLIELFNFDQEHKKWSRRPEPGTESVRWVEKSADETGIDPITVEVQEGETLYLPVGWFHEVHQSDGTIAVNYWYDRSYDQNYTKEKFIDQIAELIEDQWFFWEVCYSKRKSVSECNWILSKFEKVA